MISINTLHKYDGAIPVNKICRNTELLGKRVISISDYDDNDNIIDAHGTVIGVEQGSYFVTVEFDCDVEGHDGTFGHGKNGYCWDVDPVYLILEIREDDEVIEDLDTESFSDVIFG